MKGTFIVGDDVVRERLDWGELAWVSRPASTGAEQLVVIDVALEPGFGHDFHKHPQQEEVIWVREGRIEQWLDRDSRLLGPSDAVFIRPDVVHASFNTGTETARLTVVLAPSVGEEGYELVDMAADQPWASLRAG
jgi:quercetin dioxygenase-like cupin family protein